MADSDDRRLEAGGVTDLLREGGDIDDLWVVGDVSFVVVVVVVIVDRDDRRFVVGDTTNASWKACRRTGDREDRLCFVRGMESWVITEREAGLCDKDSLVMADREERRRRGDDGEESLVARDDLRCVFLTGGESFLAIEDC